MVYFDFSYDGSACLIDVVVVVEFVVVVAREPRWSKQRGDTDGGRS